MSHPYNLRSGSQPDAKASASNAPSAPDIVASQPAPSPAPATTPLQPGPSVHVLSPITGSPTFTFTGASLPVLAFQAGVHAAENPLASQLPLVSGASSASAAAAATHVPNPPPLATSRTTASRASTTVSRLDYVPTTIPSNFGPHSTVEEALDDLDLDQFDRPITPLQPSSQAQSIPVQPLQAMMAPPPSSQAQNIPVQQFPAMAPSMPQPTHSAMMPQSQPFLNMFPIAQGPQVSQPFPPSQPFPSMFNAPQSFPNVFPTSVPPFAHAQAAPFMYPFPYMNYDPRMSQFPQAPPGYTWTLSPPAVAANSTAADPSHTQSAFPAGTTSSGLVSTDELSAKDSMSVQRLISLTMPGMPSGQLTGHKAVSDMIQYIEDVDSAVNGAYETFHRHPGVFSFPVTNFVLSKLKEHMMLRDVCTTCTTSKTSWPAAREAILTFLKTLTDSREPKMGTFTLTRSSKDINPWDFALTEFEKVFLHFKDLEDVKIFTYLHSLADPSLTHAVLNRAPKSYEQTKTFALEEWNLERNKQLATSTPVSTPAPSENRRSDRPAQRKNLPATLPGKPTKTTFQHPDKPPVPALPTEWNTSTAEAYRTAVNNYRMEHHLCTYCGLKDHVRMTCPARLNSKARQ